MKIVRQLKQQAGLKWLKRGPEPVRLRTACNFNTAVKVGILYLDDDERFFNRVKSFSKELKEKFGIKNVRALGFVNLPQKALPIWQAQKLDFGYFTLDDLNWHLKPIERVSPFKQEEFDILLDLSDGNTVPLLYIFKESKAHLKVGRKNTYGEPYADLILMLKENHSWEDYLKQITTYLGNTTIQ